MDSINFHYKDDDIIIVEKPSLLLSVPGRGPDKQDVLSSRIQQQYPSALIIHRLDWETSGLMVFALHKKAQSLLNQQFMRREVEKTYIADIYGKLAKHGEVSVPMRCDWENRPKQMVDFILGKSATTSWQVIEYKDIIADKQLSHPTSRIKLFPLTGRSHQLRIHMLYLNTPILGDPLYAHPSALKLASRLHLHASELAFHHPIHGNWLKFTSNCPF